MHAEQQQRVTCWCATAACMLVGCGLGGITLRDRSSTWQPGSAVGLVVSVKELLALLWSMQCRTILATRLPLRKSGGTTQYVVVEASALCCGCVLGCTGLCMLLRG